MIQHVVILFQENRTPDNLFHCLPKSMGADIANAGLNSVGQFVPLAPRGLEWKGDLGHQHANFATEYNNGAMNGFDRETGSGPIATHAYKYVPCNEAAPYLAMAEHYVFGDHMFQSNQGPSLPAHQYIISGASTVDPGGLMGAPNTNMAADNPGGLSSSPEGGCDSKTGTTLLTLAWPIGSQEGNPVFPCFERQTLGDLADAAGVSWKYYQDHYGPGLWNAYDAIHHDFINPSYYAAHVIAPSSPNFLNDVTSGNLPNISWVIPPSDASDHSGNGHAYGPAWVASVVNAIGRSQYWNTTAIIVTWDDWGGWYDHVAPPLRNSYELGFRVPLLVISPYSKRGYVSHTQYEFGSILKFAEEMFGLGSLGTTDSISNDLSDGLNLSPWFRRPFVPIPAPSYAPSAERDRAIDEDP